MIAQKHRFKGRKSVLRVRSRPIRGEGFSLYFSLGRSKYWRAAVVVSKKVHKSAVVRNRIRRRIFESIRALDQENPLTKIDLSFVVHDEFLAAQNHEQLFANLDKSIKTAQKLSRAKTKSEK